MGRRLSPDYSRLSGAPISAPRRAQGPSPPRNLIRLPRRRVPIRLALARATAHLSSLPLLRRCGGWCRREPCDGGVALLRICFGLRRRCLSFLCPQARRGRHFRLDFSSLSGVARLAAELTDYLLHLWLRIASPAHRTAFRQPGSLRLRGLLTVALAGGVARRGESLSATVKDRLTLARHFQR